MHVGRTKYTAHYESGIIVAQWVSVEMVLDSDNIPTAALDRSMELVDKWCKSKNIAFEGISMLPGPPSTINIERTSEDVRIAELIRSMYACVKLDGDDGLFTFYTLACAHVETKAVYDLVKNNLVAKESKELLDASSELGESFKKEHKLDPLYKSDYDRYVAKVTKPKNKK